MDLMSFMVEIQILLSLVETLVRHQETINANLSYASRNFAVGGINIYSDRIFRGTSS